MARGVEAVWAAASVPDWAMKILASHVAILVSFSPFGPSMKNSQRIESDHIVESLDSMFLLSSIVYSLFFFSAGDKK